MTRIDQCCFEIFKGIIGQEEVANWRYPAEAHFVPCKAQNERCANSVRMLFLQAKGIRSYPNTLLDPIDTEASIAFHLGTRNLLLEYVRNISAKLLKV
jgi:hypothetical protein